MKIIKPLLLSIFITIVIMSCGGTAELVATPVENIDNTPLKVSDLTVKEKKFWAHLDLVTDTIPGMSLDKAYSELIKGRKGTTVIVAIIDSGIDIDHEDLDDVIWKNKKEIANNGKDDDGNGYVDDVHGWNFLGDTYYEQLEYVRLIASGDTSHPRYSEAQADLSKNRAETLSHKTQYSQLIEPITTSHEAISHYLKKSEYTKEEINAIKTSDPNLMRDISIINQTFGFGIGSISETIEELKSGIEYFSERLSYHFNVDFRGRKNGDDPDDFSNKHYGNNNVKPINKSESHGTHVAGIVAAERNNKKGGNGVANNVKIMPIRTVPNGDEYDKDVALAIRYAVDNGAKIINTSFGKDYSPHSDWVHDAIIYASQKDVLIISGSGNESQDVDQYLKFPNDVDSKGKEISNNYISVGALEPKYGSGMVAEYSNYGKTNVDVFAPGSEIYSTVPENEYKYEQGTSMASPAVAGVAALIRSQYPDLSASQVKRIILDSGLPVNTKVIVGDGSNVRPFKSLSSSGKMVNAYNALIMASKMVNK